MTEFAYNNSVTMGDGMSPFYANYDFHLAAMGPVSTEPLHPTSKIYTRWMHMVYDEF